MARQPSFNSQDMLEIMNKLEDTKQGQKFQSEKKDSTTSAEYLNEIRNLKSRLLKAEKDKKNLSINIKTQNFKETEVMNYKRKN